MWVSELIPDIERQPGAIEITRVAVYDTIEEARTAASIWKRASAQPYGEKYAVWVDWPADLLGEES